MSCNRNSGLYIKPEKWDNLGMKEELCNIIANDHIGKSYFFMKIRAEYISSHAQAGNFVMIAASSTTEPLLKRPFGIFKVEPPHIWLYYEIVGKGTQLMSGLKPGDRVRVIGPLGNSFPPAAGKNILMVAGGRGIAPVYYAIDSYTASGDNEVYLIYGARSKDDLNLQDEIGKLPLKKTFLYTDDGSAGTRGFVTSDILDIIEKYKIDMTISCGPDAMFEGLNRVIGGKGQENYASLEAHMGCGFGICYSCVVKNTSGDYKKVCSDGPVFKLEEIAW